MLHSSRVQRLVRTALLLTLCLLIPACGKGKVSKANFDKINTGMTLAEAEAILGKGTKEDGGDGTNVASQVGVAIEVAPAGNPLPVTTYVWEKGTKKIALDVIDGKVHRKTSSGL